MVAAGKQTTVAYPAIPCLNADTLHHSPQAVLVFVCDAAKRLGSKKVASKTYLSFYAVAMCELVASVRVDEGLLARLLPYITAGLDAEASTDYRAATLMLTAELCSRATLGKDFTKGEQWFG